MLTFKFQGQITVSRNTETELVNSSWGLLKRAKVIAIYRDSHEPKECNPNLKKKNFKKSCFAKAKNEATGFSE